MNTWWLIGYMGSGKTTIGQLIAKDSGYKFIDTDSEIEKLCNSSCHAIIEYKGIIFFRKKEHDILQQLAKKDLNNTIIATGGGMACNSDNLYIMHETGRIIYLKWTTSDLATRLRLTDLTKRPLLKNFQAHELEQHIEHSLLEREKYYIKADIIIECPIGGKACSKNDDAEIAHYISEKIKNL